MHLDACTSLDAHEHFVWGLHWSLTVPGWNRVAFTGRFAMHDWHTVTHADAHAVICMLYVLVYTNLLHKLWLLLHMETCSCWIMHVLFDWLLPLGTMLQLQTTK